MAIALWRASKCVTIFGLLVVGMRIGSLWPFDQSIFIKYNFIVQATLLNKLIAFPLLMLSICLIFYIPSLAKNAFVLQAASPTAISVLLVTKAYEKDQSCCCCSGTLYIDFIGYDTSVVIGAASIAD